MNNYNGLKNRQTWSVAVSICHDKALYDLAITCSNVFPESPYKSFINALKTYPMGMRTRNLDGTLWNDPELDIEALDEIIRGLK